MSDVPRPDPDALERLWRRMHGSLRPRMRADQAEDVVQQAFLEALKRPPADAAGFEPWLRVIVKHVASRTLQRERNRAEREREVALGRPLATPDGEAPAELREVMRRLAALPEPYREALLLRYVEGLEIEDVARRLGRSAGTVRSQLKRGLDRLRLQLGAAQQNARKRPRGFGLAWFRAAARRLGGSATSARAGVLLGSSGACALVWVLATPDAPPPTAHEPAPVASATRAVTPPAFDWRTPENSSSATLDAALVAEERSEEREQPWPTDVLGVVFDEHGRAVVGAAIHVGRQDEETGELATHTPVTNTPVTHTDAFGRFRLTHADGRRWVWAADAERVPSRRYLLASVAPEQELRLFLGPATGATLARVRNAAGQPVSGAQLTLLDPHGNGDPQVDEQGALALPPPARTAVSDAEGFSRLGCAPGQRVRLKVLARGEPPLLHEFVAPPAGQVLELALPRGAVLSGRLVLGDDAPAADVGLRLALCGHSTWQETRTDAQGRFRLSELPAGRFELTLADGHLADGSSFHLLDGLRAGETREIALRATPANTLRGLAVQDGAPLAGWVVELDREGPEWLASIRSVRTDAQGRFAFGSCAPQFKHRVRLFEPHTNRVLFQGVVRTLAEEVRLEPGERLAQRATYGGRLRVADPAHAAAFVELWSPALGQRWSSRVDPDGAFAFAGLPPVKLRMRTWMGGIGPVEYGFAEPLADQAVRFRPDVLEPGRLELELRPPPGVDRERMRVALRVPSLLGRNPNVLRWLSATPGEGVFRGHVAGGVHECLIYLDGVLIEHRDLTIEPGRTTRAIVECPELVPVTLALEADERELVETFIARVGAEPERLVPLRPVLHRPLAPFELLVPAGTTRIRVESNDGRAGEWSRASALGWGEAIVVALGPSSDAASK